jgi:hypothetical protein
MNVGSQYALFACIVSMRSWKAVSEGITRTSMDQKEVEEEVECGFSQSLGTPLDLFQYVFLSEKH